MTKKAKRGRPRSEDPMVHISVLLPSELIEQLKTDAGAGGKGLSSEIRHGLQLYLQRVQTDPETNKLLAQIRLLAENLSGDLGKKWCEHAYPMAAFKAGLAVFLGRYEPLEGTEMEPPDTAPYSGADDRADIVGRTHARLILKKDERE